MSLVLVDDRKQAVVAEVEDGAMEVSNRATGIPVLSEFLLRHLLEIELQVVLKCQGAGEIVQTNQTNTPQPGDVIRIGVIAHLLDQLQVDFIAQLRAAPAEIDQLREHDIHVRKEVLLEAADAAGEDESRQRGPGRRQFSQRRGQRLVGVQQHVLLQILGHDGHAQREVLRSAQLGVHLEPVSLR